MTKRPVSRLSIAIVLGFAVVLAQLAAFGVIGYFAWQDVAAPDSTYFRFPLTQLAQVFRGELVFPESSMNVTAKPGMVMVNPLKMACLRTVDLKTGTSHEIKTPDASAVQGLVAISERLWCYGDQEVYVYDGNSFVKAADTKQINRNRVSLPFDYEGHLAVIFRDSAGHNQLMVLVDGDWQEQGQVALPGKNRVWTIDERTGESVLVPLTSAKSRGTGSTLLQIHVVRISGQYHLIQTELLGAVVTKRTNYFSHRVGFDFVSKPSANEPASALAPDNSTADTTGWSLLDSKLNGNELGNPAVLNHQLVLASNQEIWRQVRSNESDSSDEFESIAKLETTDFCSTNLASVADSSEVYVIANPFWDHVDVYRLDDKQLQKLPYRIEGLTAGVERWLAKLFFQGLAVVTAGTLLLVLLAAYSTGEVNYSFGHDSVLLASLIRRSLARCIDLSLILGPLMLHSLWLFRFKFGASLFEFLSAFELLSVENRNALMLLIPAAVWLVLSWTALVVSTGFWGVTPGKWLCSIRVIRATLRPCGILQALLRELLLWVDAPQLLTAIPGVLCLLATENRQRIGDLASGTLVIEAVRQP